MPKSASIGCHNPLSSWRMNTLLGFRSLWMIPTEWAAAAAAAISASQPQAIVQAQRRQPAVRHGPVAEVAAGHELALEVIRYLLQLHLQQPGDVGAIAQRVPEQPEQGQLALE